MKRICVYCGSNAGTDPLYIQQAQKLGAALAASRLELVCGGGKVGLMGVIADSVLNAGGAVTGIIPKLFDRKVSHQGLTKLHLVETMHERKMMMFDLADGFIALPGGFGTIEELFEMLTWAQLGLHKKPCGLLEVNGYFAHLLSFLDNSVAAGFVKCEHREMLLVSNDPENMLEQFKSYRAPEVEK